MPHYDARKRSTQVDYSHISDLYKADFGSDHEHFELIDAALDQLRRYDIETLPIVDLGCGPGVVTDYLVGKGVKNVMAVDITAEFCEMVTNAHKEHVDVMCEDMVEYLRRCEANSIAAVIANYSIIHIPDEEIDELSSNITNALVAGGVFLMSCHKGTYKGMEQEPYQSQKDTRLEEKEVLSTYMNYFQEAELKQRIQDAGLTIVAMQTFETKIVPGEIPVPKIWLLAKK